MRRFTILLAIAWAAQMAQPAPAAQDRARAAARNKQQANAQDANNGSHELSARLEQLATGPAFDLVYLARKHEPMRVQTLPRPFRFVQLRRQVRVKLSNLGADNISIYVKPEDIDRVTLFEQILDKQGRNALERRDFMTAFELYSRLVRFSPNWPGAREQLHNVFYSQAEAALAKDPPDYETTIALSLQLRQEDRSSARVQGLLRRACLGRAQLAIDSGNYTEVWNDLDLFSKFYPDDSQAAKLRDQLRAKAEEFVQEAKQAMRGTIEQQRGTVGLLATARRIWPELPGIDRLIREARRNYPVLQVAVFEQPGTFEPLGARSLVEWQACQLVFDSLAELDDSGAQFFRGALVNRWDQKSLGLEQRLRLGHGYSWSDGTRVTAYDVKSSIRLWTDPRAENYDPERALFIGQVRIEDPFTALVRLTRGHPRPHSLLAVPLLPNHSLTEPPSRGSKFSRSPVGTGPFQVGEPETPGQTKFVANPRFRGAGLGQPYIKEINFQHYVKSSAAVRELESGRAQLMNQLTPLEVIRFAKRTGRFEVRNYLANSVYMLALNHRRGPLDQLDMRRAILLAIDRQGILNQYYHARGGGLAHRVITGPFPSHSPAYNRLLPIREPNQALAKQLVMRLKENGQLPNRVLTLKYAIGDDAVEKAASQMKKDLQRIGLDVKTEAKIAADLHHEVIDQHEFDLVYWRYDHRNVLYNIALLFDPDQTVPGGTNFMGLRRAVMSRLFGELRREQRPLELWRIQQEIHRYVYDEVVFVPLWQLDNYITYTSKLVYRTPARPGRFSSSISQLPIHPLYLFRQTEGWFLEP